MTWFYIATLVISLVLSIAMRPKTQHAPPPGLEEFSVPVAEDGMDVTAIFGTVWISDPNVLDYGNLRNYPPIKVSGGK